MVCLLFLIQKQNRENNDMVKNEEIGKSEFSIAVSKSKMDTEFIKELTTLINKHNRENISNTPDFILAEYLMACLDNFEVITNVRTVWFKELKDTKVFIK